MIHIYDAAGRLLKQGLYWNGAIFAITAAADKDTKSAGKAFVLTVYPDANCEDTTTS
jgi:hypothetical protein